MTVADYTFYLFAVIAVVAGLMVTVARNPVHSVLWLILAFLSASGLMVLMGAEFVAMLLIIVYVGAVAVLFLFVVMMLDIDFAALKGEMARAMPLGLLIGVVLIMEITMGLGAWTTAPQAEALRQEILERLIAERAQLQYARETGLKVDAAALAQAELSIARQNQLATVAELHQRIEQEGISVKDFQADVRNQVLLARLREREIEPKLRVTDAEVDAFIREQTGATAAAIDLNLAMILVAVPEGSSAAELARLQARADEVARRARAGEDFAALALEFSDANNRGRDGGVLGLRPADRYPELFVRSVQRARVGDVVGPVKSEAGFHILKLLERKQNKDLPEVRIPQTHVRHILLRTGPAQSEQVARQRLADFKRRIEAGQANFEQLAREQSQDASAADGGDLGWAPPGQFVPEFEQAMNNLDPGQISEPVVSRFGVHLIRVDGRREQVLSSSEQRQLARNVLREKKAEEAFETWAREVRGRAYVEMREPPR